MKATKFLSVLLAVVLMISCTSMGAIALTDDSAKVVVPDFYDVLAEVEATYSFLTADATVTDATQTNACYTVDDAVEYYYYASTNDEAIIDYYEGFKADVMANLEANDGKIVGSYGENITTYAAVVGTVIYAGDDPDDFGGYDLEALLENADPATVTNPYYYDIVIPVTTIVGLEDLTKALCDDFVNNYYKMGEGMDYWGVSCDNTAMFISAISQAQLEDYDEVLEDAIKVLDTYKVDGGYCYNPEYGTDPNADSTAMALRAKSMYSLYTYPTEEIVLDLSEIYYDLLSFKGDEEGSYTYYGEISLYATSDAYKGLTAFVNVIFIDALFNTTLGDLSGDGKVSVIDAKWILQSVAETRELGFKQELAADVNGDGKVSVLDAKWVLQAVAGTRELESIDY